MKNIKSLMIACLAIGAGAMTSCTDKMDNWGTDASHSRLFSVTSLSVTPEATTATVEYKGGSGATAYQIQVSTEKLNDDIEPYAEGTITIESTSMTTAVVTGLFSETNYYLRIRAIGEGKNPSLWAYYINSTDHEYFTTKGEQIMNAVLDEDRSEDAIRVTWEPGATVTHLLVHMIADEEAANDRTITLDDAAKAAGAYTVTGLAPSTGYVISIWNGQSKRGSVTATTTAEVPKGDYSYTLPEGENITQVLLNTVAENAKAAAGSETAYSATIIIPQGSTIDIVGAAEDGSAASVKIPEGMSVTFFGEGGLGANVKLSKSINLIGTHGSIIFQNLDITDGGCQYIINQSAAAVVDQLTFEKCNIHDLERSVVRTQSAGIVINKITVNNCVMTNVSSGDGYSVIQIGHADDTVQEINVTNSTLDTQKRSFIEISKLCVPKVNIANCTFYNFVQAGRYFIDANGQNTDITLTDCILGKTFTETSRGVRTTGQVVATGCIRTSDCIFASNDFKAEVGLPVGELPSTDYFTAPDSHDFTLKISDKVGDPRWYKGN
jgi:hypothetical protein